MVRRGLWLSRPFFTSRSSAFLRAQSANSSNRTMPPPSRSISLKLASGSDTVTPQAARSGRADLNSSRETRWSSVVSTT